jgi:hypothetical protein
MVVFAGAFASKPAPTFDRLWPQNLCSPQIHCGSGLAREGGLSITAYLSRNQRSRIASVRAFNTGLSK